MKIVMKLEKPLHDLTSRNVRDFLASINRRDEYTDRILWHKHIPPELIFRKPTRDGYLEVINYSNNIEMMKYLKKIAAGKEIYNSSGRSRIIKVSLKTANFEMPKVAPMIAVYKTRTPVIIASNKQEIEKVRDTGLEDSDESLRMFLKEFILDSVFYQIRHYLGIDIPEKQRKSVLIDVSEVKYFYVSYPKKEVKLSFPAVRCRVVSNFILPGFIGYRIGYGVGELIPAA